jgi:hypothetical protein
MNEREPAAIQFHLNGSGEAIVEVGLRRSGPRWVATALVGDRQIVAIGTTSRDALRLAMEPLGRTRAAALLADLGLLEPSLALLRIDAATVA